MTDIKSTINNLLEEIIGEFNIKTKIIKINRNNLNDKGDLSFPINLKAWKNFIGNITDNTNNILEYYLKRKNINTTNFSEVNIQKAFNSLMSASNLWTLPIKKISLQHEKVCLFLNRSLIIANIIKLVIKTDREYGKQLKTGKIINLKINEDSESELTTARLNKIKNICENILTTQGYNTEEENNANYKYCFTTKSQGKLSDETYQKYICGVVKNPETKSKQTTLTYEMYVEQKIKQLERMNEGKLCESTDRNEWLEKIARAIVTFEFLSVKPSQPIAIKINDNDYDNNSDETVINNKGGAFILYNAARITAILDKFNDDKLSGDYPRLWDIDKIDFTKLALEDEWCLVYNFILGYPEVLLDSVQHNIKHEFNPHTICSFLSHLCQKFSIYYRHCRILTQGRDHLIPTMMARLYLLRALQIVVHNSLSILNIQPISRM